MSPSDDDIEEFLLSCRYGDLDDVKAFHSRFGDEAVACSRDDNGNTAVHMACGNGHTDVLDFLLPHVPASLLAVQNATGSTALHWAALNAHIDVLKRLVDFAGGPGIDLIDIKNLSGLSPLGVAEQVSFDEGAQYLVQMMRLDGGEEETADTDAVVDPTQNVEVQIEDADGNLAKTTLGPVTKLPADGGTGVS
ncbi:ankyrin [Fistulina hepatica ATCC 64428]|uniref:Ankyrin n=1 Tax=Fistulina hepatica ATCC 64428 TaxID=1128425 RepID=A0A0D7A551_9AGAR|nr:ankyrin [Fistulina hepatica ATCC 64428]